jgi:phytoene dehydrogenase-like protein
VPDAVVIGAGPNGLVAANMLADRGWDVLVLEANDIPGGAVRTAEVTAPGFKNDLFSAFYPLAAASKTLASLGLDRYGLRWVHAPAVVANPTPDGPAAVIHRDLDATAESLEQFAPGDGEAWRSLYAKWEQVGDALVDVLLSPFPPVRGGLKLLAALGPSGLLPFVRFGLLPLRRLGEEYFRGEGGPLILSSNALHADLTPEGAAGGLFGWLLASLGQDVGFPVPEGGAQRLIDALVARLEAKGGRVECGVRVERIEIRDGQAVGVRTNSGETVAAAKAVLADTDAQILYRRLVGEEHLPPRVVRDLELFQRSPGTVKVDWALSSPIPWADPAVAPAGTVHVADSVDDLTRFSGELAMGVVPAKPFLLVGQMTTTDPTRSPPGTESVWAYTHVPTRPKADAGGDGITGKWDDRETDAIVDRIEARIESYAPGFRDRIIGRHVFTPVKFKQDNENLVGGDVNGGTAQLHQMLVFRPLPGLGRAETPVKRLYLASASAHPGGGVHGGPGASAARAALLHDGLGPKVLAVAGAASAALALARSRRQP